MGEGTSTQADQADNAARPCARAGTAAPPDNIELDCMVVDPPEQRAQLLAQLQAEAAAAHQHVQEMQPLAPMPAIKPQATLDRSQAGPTPDQLAYLHAVLRASLEACDYADLHTSTP